MWCYSCALFFSLKPWQASLFVCMQGLCLNCCLVSLLFMLAGEVIFCFLFFSFSKDVVIFLLPLPLTARNLLVLTGIRGGSEIKNLASENNMGSHWVWEVMPRSSKVQVLSPHMGRLWCAACAPPCPLPFQGKDCGLTLSSTMYQAPDNWNSSSIKHSSVNLGPDFIHCFTCY